MNTGRNYPALVHQRLRAQGALPAMAIEYLDVVNLALAPFKTNTPLFVDRDAVQAHAGRPVRHRQPTVLHRHRLVQRPQVAQSDPLNLFRDPIRSLPAENPFGLPGFERFDHGIIELFPQW